MPPTPRTAQTKDGLRRAPSFVDLDRNLACLIEENLRHRARVQATYQRPQPVLPGQKV